MARVFPVAYSSNSAAIANKGTDIPVRCRAHDIHWF
jgi:hypothetical protein